MKLRENCGKLNLCHIKIYFGSEGEKQWYLNINIGKYHGESLGVERLIHIQEFPKLWTLQGRV